MTKRMLIDATHEEETRVAIVDGNRLEEFEFENLSRKELKGNIYLAKITRVEPSLQAAFVEYGGNRHGFLPFPEIHTDYYKIPVADQERLAEEAEEAEEKDTETTVEGDIAETKTETTDEDIVDIVGTDDVENVGRKRKSSPPRYKIQEVIKSRQILLVQVTKEERGNKGAALTTFLSLSGRYCVLMPNSPNSGGISRKITSLQERKKLKAIIAELEVSEGMSAILRTAGVKVNKTEIKRDFEYLLQLWGDIRNLTLESSAPMLVHEESNLAKRAIRDLYNRNIKDILVAGNKTYESIKDFMQVLIPTQVKKVQPYVDESVSLFSRYQVESQIDAVYEPDVPLKSGGSLVINQTEALVCIDVNSGRATRERHIEETALKTNLEAAEEVARQLRLRDLGGLVVIDFIDMENPKHDAAVERCFREAMKNDRARIQIGRISAFGLLEMSRQRMHPSLIETNFDACPHCQGRGLLRSVESSAILILRGVEEGLSNQSASGVTLFVTNDIALYFLNRKRKMLSVLEQNHGVAITIQIDPSLAVSDFRIESGNAIPAPENNVKSASPKRQDRQKPAGRSRSRRRSSRSKRDDNRSPEKENQATVEQPAQEVVEPKNSKKIDPPKSRPARKGWWQSLLDQ